MYVAQKVSVYTPSSITSALISEAVIYFDGAVGLDLICSSSIVKSGSASFVDSKD